MSEIREIRNRMSKRLHDAERREGTCVPELRRLGRKAAAGMARDSAPPSKSRRKAQ